WEGLAESWNWTRDREQIPTDFMKEHTHTHTQIHTHTHTDTHIYTHTDTHTHTHTHTRTHAQSSDAARATVDVFSRPPGLRRCTLSPHPQPAAFVLSPTVLCVCVCVCVCV